MAHDHHHHHNHSSDIRNLKIAFFVNLFFTIVEIIGGIYVNSVAILSDAIHDLGDSLSLGTAWYLQNKSKQQADEKFSYGYARFSLLGALVNSVVLIGGSIFVVNEAIKRIMSPEASDAKGMILFAILGILVNAYAAWKLSHGKSLNEKVVSWHLVEDVLGWVAVLFVGIVLLFVEINYLDPVLSLLITIYILFNVIKRLRETLYIFLQGIPAGVDLEKVKQSILNIENVDSIHHTHIWSLEGEHHVFSTHLKLREINSLVQLANVKAALKKELGQFHFNHYTIEIELSDEICGLTQTKIES